MVLSAVADFGISKLRDAISGSGKDGVLDMLVEAGIDTSDSVLNKVDGMFNEDGTSDAERVRGFWQEHFGKNDEPEAEKGLSWSWSSLFSMFSSKDESLLDKFKSSIVEKITGFVDMLSGLKSAAANLGGDIGNRASSALASVTGAIGGFAPMIVGMIQNFTFGSSDEPETELAHDDTTIERTVEEPIETAGLAGANAQKPFETAALDPSQGLQERDPALDLEAAPKV